MVWSTILDSTSSMKAIHGTMILSIVSVIAQLLSVSTDTVTSIAKQ
jgi:hypothetical protein